MASYQAKSPAAPINTLLSRASITTATEAAVAPYIHIHDKS
jgi:hypothetical protein